MATVGLLGGTGNLGKGLAVHLAKFSEQVMIGSRSEDKAKSVVEEILSEKTNESDFLKVKLHPTSNAVIPAKADTIIATVPFESAVDTVRSLKERFRGDQLFISAAAFLEKKGSEFHSGTGDSISQQIRSILPDSVRLATAFQTVPAVVLYRSDSVEGDVLVSCDEKNTFDACASLIRNIRNLRPLYAGSLAVSGQIEGLTSILLNIGIKNHLKNPTFKVLDRPLEN
jgi:8-hydroxy-5-deazaflavin:NADPH oxidoreductase